MRYVVLLVLLAFSSGCSPAFWGNPVSRTPPPAATSGPTVAVQNARADSLLALPSDSLSAADQAWLNAYAARQPRRNGTHGAVLGAISIGAILFLVYILATETAVF